MLVAFPKAEHAQTNRTPFPVRTHKQMGETSIPQVIDESESILATRTPYLP